MTDPSAGRLEHRPEPDSPPSPSSGGPRREPAAPHDQAVMNAAANSPSKVVGRSWIRFLIGAAILWGVLAGIAEFDATGQWGPLIFAAVAVAAVGVEMVLYRSPARQAIRFLGLSRPSWRSVIVAAAASGLVLLAFPLTTAVTGGQIELVPNWPWILLGIFAFHGLAEEIVWRGFIFRRVNTGRPFRTAVLWTMPLIAVAHIPVVVDNGIVVAIGAMLVAAVTSVPFSYLYLTGRGTIWAPALIHTAIDSFKLVTIPATVTPTFSMLLIGVSILVPLLVFAVPRRVIAPPPAATTREPTAHVGSRFEEIR
jgi:membrane protease YdiL (CAAX protease family)